MPILTNNNRVKSAVVEMAAKFMARAMIVPLVLLAMTITAFTVAPVSAETRTLKIYYVHTRERSEITFKENGRYIPAGLKKLNYALRDWRRNEPTNMDPRLFDLVWQIYQLSGSKDYIHVVSAYRSPKTNTMLRNRSRSSGVAKNSQHTLGKALDFYIPDVRLATLREIGLKLQGGGVGYYPKSGSPFVHMDVGSVRHWPRMTRQELVAVFPKGNTLHIPTDGKPLPGYQQALADYNARGKTAIAMVQEQSPQRQTLFGRLFGGRNDPAPQPAARPTQQQRVEPTQNRVEAPAMIASLDAENVPVPVFSPFAQADAAEDVAPEEPAITDAVLAYADVPVPMFRPNDGVDDNGLQEAQQVAGLDPEEEEDNALIALNMDVPIPLERPQLTPDDPENIDTPDKSILTAAISPDSANTAIDDDISALIAQQDDDDLIVAPSLWEDEETTNAQSNVAQSVDNDSSQNMVVANVPPTPVARPQSTSQVPEPNIVAALEQPAASASDAIEVAAIDKQQLAQRQQELQAVLSRRREAEPEDTGVLTTDKEPRPGLHTSAQKQDEAGFSPQFDITPEQELRQVPELVYLSGLRPKPDMQQTARLQGKAIQFKTVTRVINSSSNL